MKVTCQSCQAKYTIADDKVRGKVAKIRCKKCGTTIIVNGTDAAPGGAVADYTQQGAVDEQWSILVADGDQRTLTITQVAELYTGGSISFETPAWKDGMADWLPISQIDALRSVLELGPQPSMLPDQGMMASLLPDVPQGNASPAAPPPMALAAEPVVPRAAAPVAPRANNAAEPAARRRPRGGSTDLFGAAAQDDVMTSASADPVPHMPSPAADKPTGARNENSVLFSLAALTGGPGTSTSSPGKAAPAGDKAAPTSSRADLRSLVGGTPVEAGPQKSKLDDIINLSGGGVYSPGMLTAPILAPPPADMRASADALDAPAKPKSNGRLIIAALGILLVVGGAAAYVMNSKAESDKAMAAASASAKAASDALAAALAAAQEAKAAPEPGAPGASASAEAAPTAPTALAPGQAAPKADTEKKTIVAKADKPDKSAPAAAPPAAAALGIPPPAPAAPKEPAPPPAASGADFDRAAALSALSAAATAAQSCKKGDGPTGSGRIAVTFANNGMATTANVEGPPFAGTTVGGCVAARFRGTHVPPFGGAPVTVHKTFNIN
jgi:predicted Zn finger-like uncharacterized protein